MLRGFFCVFAMGLVWGCGGEQVMQSQMVEGEEQVGRPLSKLAVQTSASHAVVVATVLRDGAPVIWAKVEFSRSIAGQVADYQWSGVTDENGRARVEITSGDVTGYYQARASIDEREIGSWSSIPINGGYEVMLDLPIGGRMRVMGSPMRIPQPGDAIKIGFIYGTYRKNSLDGATLAALQFNEEGGVRGVPIELIDGGVPIEQLAEKNISETEYVAALAEKLITQEKVLAIVGPNRSSQAVIVGDIAQRHGIPMMTTNATNPIVSTAGDFVFMAAFTDDFQGKVMAEFAIQELGAGRVAVLTERGSIYSEGLSQTFVDNFGALGGHVAAHQFYMSGETDFASQLIAVTSSMPDVVFIPGSVVDIPLLVQQARQNFGLTATFLGGDSWHNAELLTTSSAFIEGSFFSGFFSSQVAPGDLSEDAHRFIDAYTAMFGVAPDGSAALGYDALRLVVQAMRRTDALTPMAIRDEIAATRDYSGATFISGYDENRHTTKSAVINRIANGAIEFYKLIEP